MCTSHYNTMMQYNVMVYNTLDYLTEQCLCLMEVTNYTVHQQNNYFITMWGHNNWVQVYFDNELCSTQALFCNCATWQCGKSYNRNMNRHKMPINHSASLCSHLFSYVIQLHWLMCIFLSCFYLTNTDHIQWDQYCNTFIAEPAGLA